MIDTTTLRIGNSVVFGGDTCEVENIRKNMCLLKFNRNYNNPISQKYTDIYGLPIDELLLMAIGFEKATDVQYGGWCGPTLDNGSKVRIRMDAKSYYYTPNDYSDPIRLYYLHQWQNLYFALTGVELVINQRVVAERSAATAAQ